MFNASQRISELERNVEELKRKAAQNSGEAEYIEKVVYTVKQSAEDVKKVSRALLTAQLCEQGSKRSPPGLPWNGYSSETSWVTCFETAVFKDKDGKEWEWI